MNLPNKLTITRCVMTFLFLVVLMLDFPFHYGVALVLFAVASLTDFLDGKIARKNGLVTNLGKFLDPLADKTLTTAAFLGLMTCLPQYAASLCWAVMLILTREFAVTSVRLLAAKDGVVVAASMAGKLKTVVQMFAIMYLLAALQVVALLPASLCTLGTVLLDVGQVLVWISVVLTLVSGVQYVWNCRKYFTEK